MIQYRQRFLKKLYQIYLNAFRPSPLLCVQENKSDQHRKYKAQVTRTQEMLGIPLNSLAPYVVVNFRKI